MLKLNFLRLTVCIIGLFFQMTLCAQECSYNDYFNQITLAKKDYNENDFKEASKKLKKAFLMVDFPHGHDLSFALVTAKKTNDDVWMEEIAIQLAKGGVPLKYYKYYKKYSWYKTLEKDFNKHIKYYQDNFDIELKNRWIALILKDRAVNEKFHSFREAKIKMTIQEMIDDAYSVSNGLNEIVKSKGFPGENNIGYLYVSGRNRVEPFPVLVLLRHIYQRGESLLKGEIPSLICEGKLLPYCKEVLLSKNEKYYDLGLEKVMTIMHSRYNKAN